MTRIWKFGVKPERFELELPVGSKFLSVQMQHNVPVMWFLYEDEEDIPIERRMFRCVPTGESVESKWLYLGTFQLHAGTHVLHLFEIP